MFEIVLEAHASLFMNHSKWFTYESDNAYDEMVSCLKAEYTSMLSETNLSSNVIIIYITAESKRKPILTALHKISILMLTLNNIIITFLQTYNFKIIYCHYKNK